MDRKSNKLTFAPTEDNFDIDEVIKLVKADAEKKRQNASYNGEMSDGGAGRLEEQIKFYNYGRQAIVPQEWDSYKQQLDPEYAEYKRLKEKFERRK
jgi:hypothetical protein